MAGVGHVRFRVRFFWRCPMSAVEVVIHNTGNGICSLSGKECEGMTVSFKDGTLREGFLSHKAFLQLVKMKFAQAKPESRPDVRPVVAMSASGPVAPPK